MLSLEEGPGMDRSWTENGSSTGSKRQETLLTKKIP